MTGVRSPLHSNIAQILEGYRLGRWSVEQVTRLHLDRLAKFKASNAVISDWSERALKLAIEKDQILKSQGTRVIDEFPLFGIPFTVKGTFSIQGQPWAAGLVHRKDIKANQTATVVQRAINAGGIPLCLTNTPEAITWIETFNKVNGRTLHPLDPTRTPGGSSGGEAVVLGTGGAVFGIGTDLGGSIRIPSAFCGISGHKPSPGWIPGSGQYPEPFGKLWNYCVTGPMARFSSDLPRLMNVLSGPDGYDPSICEKKPLSVPIAMPLKNLQFYFLDEIPGVSVDRKIHETMDLIKSRIRAADGKIQKLDRNLFKSATAIWFAFLSENSHRGPSFRKILGGDRELALHTEWLNFIFGKSPHTFPCLVLATMEKLSALQSQKRVRVLYEEGQKLKRELNKILGSQGVIICPVYPTPAPKHHYPKLRPFAWVYSGIFNAMEMPATSFPVDYCNPSGLSLGVQVVAGSNQDQNCLAVAEALDAGPRISGTE